MRQKAEANACSLLEVLADLTLIRGPWARYAAEVGLLARSGMQYSGVRNAAPWMPGTTMLY